jgi:hypothetical protein
MAEILELLSDVETEESLLFATEEEYLEFRASFVEEVLPIQEAWREARMRSEEESRERLLG